MNELPNLGADVVLEFQQSLNNIQLFGTALEGLDAKFGNMERRIDGMRSSLSSLSSQVSKGSGSNLRADMERELNNLIANNGIVLSKVGTSALKVNAETVRSVFNKVESAINLKLAESFKNIVLDMNPSMNTGKVPISKDDFDEVNRAIARLVRVQLNNLVSALRRHGSGLISAQDLASVQLTIGKGTVQQIINKVKDHLKAILLNPSLGAGATIEFTDRDLQRIFNAIRDKVQLAVNDAVAKVDGSKQTADFAPNVGKIFEAVDKSARDYIRNVTQGINSISSASMTKPLSQLSNQLRRQMAKELGTDLETFNREFAKHQFTSGDIQSSELRRQFARLEQALNRKIGGGLREEVNEILRQIEGVEINYSPRLRFHLVKEIGRINNQIIKKIREQIDIQFANMRAEINGVQVAPKDINRSRRIRDLGRVSYDGTTGSAERAAPRPLANDPYAKRDAHFNTFGLQGAIVNTFRHILAGSMVGAPMMLMYKTFETYKTSQLEQLKMFANFFAKANAETDQRNAAGDKRDGVEYASDSVREIIPYLKDASQYYAIGYDKMSQVAGVGSRLLEDPAEVKTFTDVVSRIYNIDREGDPATTIAPGLEAFMGQFGLAVGELDSRITRALAYVTNETNATTEGVMNALMRSGSVFRGAGVEPEEAIAMVAASIKYTGLTGENIGNFYKTILPRMQNPTALKEMERFGVQVYDESEGFKKSRGAVTIMSDIAKLLPELDDEARNGLIKALYGTHQRSKGDTTLSEFTDILDLIQGLELFSVDNLNSLLNANLQNPYIEMTRSGESMVTALSDVIEELTPEVVAISKSITDLASGIREHKEALAGFISFLGNALLGYATVLGARKLGSATGMKHNIQQVADVDAVLGNAGIAGRGRTQGAMSRNFGAYAREGALDNTKSNRMLVNNALRNEALAPTIKNLADMNAEQIKAMQGYMRDNNIRVRGIKDLAIVAEEARGYIPRQRMNPDQIWGGSMQASGRLYRKGAMGLDENFANEFAQSMRDKSKFDQLGNTVQGRRVTGFIAGLSADELQKFQNHLENIHASTGKPINSIGKLTQAVNTYTKAQAQNRNEIRATSPHLLALSNSMGRVATSMNNSEMQRGLRNMDAFIGGISTKARGATAAFGALGKTVGRLGAQMLLFAGVGEIVGNVMSPSRYYTQEEKDVNRTQKALQDIDTYRSWMEQGTAGQMATVFKTFLMQAWDTVTFGTGDRTTIGNMTDIGFDIGKYLNETYGVDNSNWDNSSKHLTEQANKLGKTVDEIINEYMSWDNGDESIREAARKASVADYIKKMEQRSLDDKDQKVIDEGVRQAVEKRQQRAIRAGEYQDFDLESIKADVAEQVKELNAETTLQQLKTINKGYSTDSEEYLKIRRKFAEQEMEIYQSTLDNVRLALEGARDNLASAKATGDEALIQEAIREENRWSTNLEKSTSEFGVLKGQAEQAQIQLDFEGALSRIARTVSMLEANQAIDSAVRDSTMDRGSKEYIDASIGSARDRINDLSVQVESLRGTPVTADQQNQIDLQILQLQGAMQQERLQIRDLQLNAIGIYKQDLQDNLSQMSNDYLRARVESGGMDDNSPLMRNLRVEQYEKQVGMFDSIITDLQRQLKATSDAEAQKTLQREIRDLQRQSLQAQLGILDEMKNTGGTFNLPDNVKAMSYYEYVTRNNTHSTYTVQGGDTHVTVTLPNITDGTSAERIRQIGKAFGEGLNEGKSLRLQKQANPFGYRG